jgi:UDP-3-O-[3-hydroxymyristoyl] glucosamine N-acyltransferase
MGASVRVYANQIARVIPDARLLGDEEAVVSAAHPLSCAQPRSLSWLKKGQVPHDWQGSVLIVAKGTIARLAPSQAIIEHENPRLALGYALRHFFLPQSGKLTVTIAPSAHIDPSAIIGRAGQSLEWDPYTKSLFRIPHIAGVTIGEGVRIGPLATIVRGVLEDTVVGEGTSVGNHANVGHGARVGRHCILAPYAAIGGSTVLGDHVTIWQHAAIRNGLRIGDAAVIAQGASLVCDVPAGEVWGGVPAEKM